MSSKTLPASAFRDRAFDVWSEPKTNPQGVKFRRLIFSKCLCGQALPFTSQPKTRFSNSHLKDHRDAYEKEKETYSK